MELKRLTIKLIPKFCTCGFGGKGDGYRLNRKDGIWKHNVCGLPTRQVLEALEKGTLKPQCPKGILKSGKCSQRKVAK